MRTQKNRVCTKNNLLVTTGKTINEENIDQNQSVRYRIRRKGQPTIFVSLKKKKIVFNLFYKIYI